MQQHLLHAADGDAIDHVGIEVFSNLDDLVDVRRLVHVAFDDDFMVQRGDRQRTDLKGLKPRGNAGFFITFVHHETGSEYSSYSGMDINRTNHGGVYSFHTGANVSMGDGRVVFKVENTDSTLMAALFSRDGGAEEAQRLAEYNVRP